MQKKILECHEIRLIEGEEEAAALGDESCALLLTNRRVIRLSREGQTSKATVAFLQDIVTAKVVRTRANEMLLFVGIVLALAGLVWFLYSGFENGFEEAFTLAGIGGVLLGLIVLSLYWSLGSAQIAFETAKSDIIFPLGPKSSARAYPFVNRFSELKGIVSRSAGEVSTTRT